MNFSLFSKHATRIELLFFEHSNAVRPSRVMPWQAARPLGGPRAYRTAPRSVVVLWGRLDPTTAAA